MIIETNELSFDDKLTTDKIQRLIGLIKIFLHYTLPGYVDKVNVSPNDIIFYFGKPDTHGLYEHECYLSRTEGSDGYYEIRTNWNHNKNTKSGVCTRYLLGTSEFELLKQVCYF